MRRTWSAAGAAAATLCLSLLAPVAASQAADPAHVPVWDNGPAGERYVAMGDSFVAGPAIPTVRKESGACSRSDHNFPTLVATALDVQSFIDASCSGAKTEHFWAAQGANAPQLDAVTADTTLVTFGTMGGNDVGLVDLATTCATALCAGAPGDAYHQKVDEVADSLTEGLRAVKARAPEAVILVVGHGTYIPPAGCVLLGSTIVIEPSEAVYLQGLIDHLSDVMEQVATAEGASFVDMRDIPGAADHTVCAAPEDQWVRGVNTYRDGAPLHPSTAGMAAMAGQVLSVLKPIWDASPIHPIAPGVLPVPTPSTPPTTPAPPAGPAPVSHETLLAQAEAALDKVVTGSTCYTPKSHRVVRFKVRHTQELVDRVVFRIGKKVVGTDRSGPFVLQRRASKMAKLDGRVKARVTVINGDVTASRVLKIRRARCLR